MENKLIELTQSQIKAYDNGATMFIVPIVGNNFIHKDTKKTIEPHKIEIGKPLDKDGNHLYFYNKEQEPYFVNDKECRHSYYMHIVKFIKNYSPIQKGDKDIFVQEEFSLYSETQIDYKVDTPDISLCWHPDSEMTKEQSRYTISECIDVRVVRVQDIRYRGLKVLGLENSTSKNVENEIKSLYNNQLKEQNINRTYHDNDYVFLIEVKR